MPASARCGSQGDSVDALMAALMVAVLVQAGDRTPWLAAILADRYRPATVLAGGTIALAVVYAAGAAAGMAIAPLFSPAVKQMFLGLALMLAAIGLPFAPKPPDRLTGWRIGGFATASLGLAILAFGDATQFVVVALAARSPVPWLAAVGATLGALVAVAPAALLGEAGWRALPWRPARSGATAMLGIAGVVLGLTGGRLI